MSRGKMSEFQKIFERFKNAINAKNDADVARALKVSTAAMSGFKKREKIPADRLIGFCLKNKISIDYILLGKTIQKSEPDANEKNNVFEIQATVKIFRAKTAEDAYHEIAELERLYNSVYPLKRLHISLPKKESEKWLQGMKEKS